MAYNTGNPIGSGDPRDLRDNAENLDNAANSDNATWTDRLGQSRRTMAGIEQDAIAAIQNAGYVGTGTDNAVEDYAAGIEITQYNQIVRDPSTGEFWRVSGSETLPYTTTGAGLPEGGALVSVGDAALRQDLVQPVATFNNVADMKASTGLGVGRKVRTLGYYAPGDGGGNDYEIVAAGTGTDDGGSFIDLAGSGTQAKGLFVNGVISVGQFGAEPETDSQNAIQIAVDYCLDKDTSLFWPSKTYISTGNIDNFWRIVHEGYGIIERGTDTFYITPLYNYFDNEQLNVVYAGSGVSSNDGLTPNYPLPPVQLLNVARSIGNKAGDGVWRFQFQEGTLLERGLRLSDFPVFRNPLEIVGNIDTNGDPSTIWDGTGNVETYALRGDLTSVRHNIRIKDIHFTNWSSGASAIYDGHVEEHNCWVTNTGNVGFWHRTGYHKTTNCHFEDTSNTAVRNQYHTSFNVEDCTFNNCNIGVLAGRNAAGHVARCTFDNMGSHCISGVMESRIRTYDNVYNSWTTAAVRADASTWNGEASDTFNGLSSGNPAVLAVGGANISPANHRTEQFLHRSSSTTGVTIQDPSVRTSLGSLSGFVDPYSIPGWVLYSETAKLHFEFLVQIGSGMETTIQLTGEGTALTLVLAEATLPSSSSNKHWKVTFEVWGPRGTLSSGDYMVTATSESGQTFFKRGVTGDYDTTLTRNTSASTIPIRGYLQTDVNAGAVTPRGFRSYLEI